MRKVIVTIMLLSVLLVACAPEPAYIGSAEEIKEQEETSAWEEFVQDLEDAGQEPIEEFNGANVYYFNHLTVNGLVGCFVAVGYGAPNSVSIDCVGSGGD